MKNIIQTKFAAAESTQIASLLDQLEAALAGKLTTLTEEERVKFGSINEQNKLLVNKVRDYNENQPQLSAPQVDWTEYASDFAARGELESNIQRMQSIVHRMQSTKIMHDYDNYQDALKDYAYAKYMRDAGEPGYAEKVAELKQFFNRTGSSSQNESGPTP